MTINPLRRQEFDPEMDFTCLKGFSCGGKRFESGEPFDKVLVPVRRLRQMYDGRFITGKLPEGFVAKKTARPRAFGDIEFPSDLLQAAEKQADDILGISEERIAFVDVNEPLPYGRTDSVALTANEFRALQKKPVERVRIKEED